MTKYFDATLFLFRQLESPLLGIGVLALYALRKALTVAMTRPVETLEIVVSGKPVRAGIDLFHELIDAHPGDNVRSL